MSALGRARYGGSPKNPYNLVISCGRSSKNASPTCASGGRAVWHVNFVEVRLEPCEIDARHALPRPPKTFSGSKRTKCIPSTAPLPGADGGMGVATPVNQALHVLVKLLEEPANDAHPASWGPPVSPRVFQAVSRDEIVDIWGG